jgi:hypothetical protein
VVNIVPGFGETAGAALKSGDVEELLQKPEIKYLSEMMNFPGVIANAEPHATAFRGKPANFFDQAKFSEPAEFHQRCL